MDWIIFCHYNLKLFDIRHALYLILSTVHIMMLTKIIFL